MKSGKFCVYCSKLLMTQKEQTMISQQKQAILNDFDVVSPIEITPTSNISQKSCKCTDCQCDEPKNEDSITVELITGSKGSETVDPEFFRKGWEMLNDPNLLKTKKI